MSERWISRARRTLVDPGGRRNVYVAVDGHVRGAGSGGLVRAGGGPVRPVPWSGQVGRGRDGGLVVWRPVLGTPETGLPIGELESMAADAVSAD